MSIFADYFNYYIYGIDNSVKKVEVKTSTEKEKNLDKKYLITLNDLKSVNLQPVKDIIPAPSRNMPPLFDKINLQNLNKAQLECILNVKLKPIPKLEKIIFYQPRHPVLAELLKKFEKI
jgi:hypothetical protein